MRRNIEFFFYTLFRKYHKLIFILVMIRVDSHICRGKESTVEACQSVSVSHDFLNFIGLVV